MNTKIFYHTRHIPVAHLNQDTPMGKDVVSNGLCDVLESPNAETMAEYGIDIIETRAVWYESEAKQGCIDFSRLKADIAKIKEKGFGVGVFPWFQHPPAWENNGVKLTCLEHGEKSTLISLWDDTLLAVYDRMYGALSPESREEIDFLYVGVYGDYGEVFFPNGVRHYVFSPPHNHRGMWCGDPLARASFKAFLQSKYETIDRLNEVWETECRDFDEDLMGCSDTIAYKRDIAKWYSESLMSFADKVCAVARKHFPTTRMGLPIGHVYEPIEIGQVKSMAAKLAATYNLTARWTGWAHLKDFGLSNVCARRIASAASFYGAEFGVEAALILDEDNAANAMFEALSNKATIIHNDSGNIVKAMNIYSLLKTLPVEESYVTQTAIFYPLEAEQCGVTDMESFYRQAAVLRRYVDYDIFDSYMLEDGYGSVLKTVILLPETYITQQTAEEFLHLQSAGVTFYHISGCAPRLLETGENIAIGTAICDYSQFGEDDGCFYTQCGEKLYCYNPKTRVICLK